jgi:hypothetical protein
MATLIIANTYVAFLVSYLSAPKLYNVVNSLEELSQQSTLKWTFRRGTAHQGLFQVRATFHPSSSFISHRKSSKRYVMN